jgi:hypothetical protein
MKCAEETLEVRINKQRDPDRSHLRRVLEAQFAYERMSTARSMLAHLLAIVGAVIWIQAIWPDLLPEEARFFTLLFWGSILFVTLWVAVEEYVWRRKLNRYLAQKGGVSLHRIEEPF